jgi:hypothetical protein
MWRRGQVSCRTTVRIYGQTVQRVAIIIGGGGGGDGTVGVGGGAANTGGLRQRRALSDLAQTVLGATVVDRVVGEAHVVLLGATSAGRERREMGLVLSWVGGRTRIIRRRILLQLSNGVLLALLLLLSHLLVINSRRRGLALSSQS